jgi:hypothetical protein
MCRMSSRASRSSCDTIRAFHRQSPSSRNIPRSAPSQSTFRYSSDGLLGQERERAERQERPVCIGAACLERCAGYRRFNTSLVLHGTSIPNTSTAGFRNRKRTFKKCHVNSSFMWTKPLVSTMWIDDDRAEIPVAVDRYSKPSTLTA